MGNSTPMFFYVVVINKKVLIGWKKKVCRKIKQMIVVIVKMKR